MKQTKKAKVLKHLQTRRRGLTGLDALKLFGLYRLSATIHELRSEGYDIKTEMMTPDDPDESKYARYYI
ncbi:MAG: hypothetical protein IIX01_04045 [Clostridia bacterium]|nr:hypothetical protein [Clostridia bacterium]